jgi:hypothetical protein
MSNSNLKKSGSILFSSKTRNVTVHLNSKEDVTFICSAKETFEDIFEKIKKEKGFNVSVDTHKLIQKNGIDINITFNITEDIELNLNPPYDPKQIIDNQIFGKSLGEASKRGVKGLPIVLSSCFKYLQTEHGYKTIGLFRIKGDPKEIKKYKQYYDEQIAVEFSNTDPHVVAGYFFNNF